MENKTVLTNEKPIIPLEKVVESTGEIPKPKASINKIVIALLVFMVIALGAAVFVLYNRTLSPLEPKSVIPQTEEVSVSPTVPDAETNGWLTYTDKRVGFSFNYPKTVFIDDDSKGEDGLVLSVSAEKLTDIPEDLPINMGRNDAIEQKNELKNAEGNLIRKIGSLNGQIGFGYSQFEVCSVYFSRNLTFYPGEYRVRLNLSGPVEKIQADMPSFFKVDPSNCGDQKMWNPDATETFESTVAMQKGSGMGQEWYNTFYGIIDTLKLITPETPVSGTTYTNEKYGFELNYDAPYKLLVDKDNLYGYPNGVALLYKGGQAYDIVIEVWNSEAEYKNMYSFRIADVSIFQSKGKYITFLNNTNSVENQNIIDSVKILP